MTLDAELLEILVCPNDRGDVDYHEDEQVIVCRTCGYRYPVRDGIPVMLIDEAEKPGDGRSAKPAAKPKGTSKRTPTRRHGMIDLDDVRAVRDQDPGGMLDAIAALGSDCREGYAHGAEAVGLPRPRRCPRAWCSAAWEGPPSPATSCGPCSATAWACRSR